MTDSGLYACVLGMSAGRLVTPESAGGPVVETWVLGELGRQLNWNTPEARLYHYRTRDGIEVDAVLEDPRGRVVGVEVKAAETGTGQRLPRPDAPAGHARRAVPGRIRAPSGHRVPRVRRPAPRLAGRGPHV
ncbi:MAG: DUF4143 domain-containing protein [Actinomycetota bacterium]|nr:DUF4143 domain-containing protein [Actinomycetota bacterium]